MLVLFASDVSSLVPPALVAAIVSGVVALGVCRFTNRENQARFIAGLVQKIIEFSMTYPYLEDDAFCRSWPDTEDDEKGEKRMRYENYCCHVFNTMEHVWEHGRHEANGTKHYLYCEELVLRHRAWWKSDAGNRSGYDRGFQDFVNDILNTSPARDHPK